MPDTSKVLPGLVMSLPTASSPCCPLASSSIVDIDSSPVRLQNTHQAKVKPCSEVDVYQNITSVITEIL